MRGIFFLVFSLMVGTKALAFDPFVNLVRLKEAEIYRQKLREQNRLTLVKQREKQELRLFTPVIRKPLSELSIQGVISSSHGYRLVLLDPSTGETFLLKPGDPVGKSEKLLKVTPKEVVIVKFKRKGLKIAKSYERIKIDLGGE